MNLAKISWFLWVPGAIAIALSWSGTVSRTVGWIGFGLACLGSLIGMLARKR